MTINVPLMGSPVESSYGAAPGAAPGGFSRARRSWTTPAAIAGAVLLGAAGTLVSVDGTVFGPSSPLARLGAAKEINPEDYAPPAPTYEEAMLVEPVFTGNVEDLEPLKYDQPATPAVKQWIRDHYDDAEASDIIAALEADDAKRGESAKRAVVDDKDDDASLGDQSEKDLYSTTCELPKAQPMPAGCLVQEIRPMVSCEYDAIAQSKIPNVATCTLPDIPQFAIPKANDDGFKWSWTVSVDVPYKSWENNACDQGYSYPCQTGTDQHCVKIFGKKRCTSTPRMGTCHGSRKISCFVDRVKKVEHTETLKKTYMTCQRQSFAVPGAECEQCLPGFVKQDGACVSLIDKETNKLKNKAMAICEAIPSAVEKAGDVIMETLFPSDASALGDMLADVFAAATGSAASSASLGGSRRFVSDKKMSRLGQKAFRAHARRVNAGLVGPDTTLDLFDNPENHHLLRDAIRAALVGDESFVSKASFLGRAPEKDKAKLGSRDCSVLPVEILDADDFEDLEGVQFDMPWPAKLANAPYAPNSFMLKLPVITFKTCTSQAPMTFPDSIGKDIIQAISDFFRPLIVGGFDELKKIDCGDILEVINEVREEMRKVLDDVTDELKKVKKFAGRKMLEETADPVRRAAITALMDEEDDNMYEMHARMYEEIIFSRAMALRALFDVPTHSQWTDDYLAEPANFRAQTALLGGAGSAPHAAALGGSSFGDRLKQLGLDLKKALEGIKNIGMGWTIEQEISVGMGFSAQSDAADQFMNGEIFDSLGVAEDIADGMSKEKEIPIFATLGASVVVDTEMLMPFFLLTDGKIDFALESGVKTAISFGVKNLQPYFEFQPPTPFFKSDSAVSAALHFQQGLQFILNEFSIGICAGGTCTGPVLGFQQDVYFGVDMVAVAAASDAATCYRGPTTLSTNFVQWDYPENTKKECAIQATGGSFAMGAYVQVPAPQLSLVMSSWSGNIAAEIANFHIQDAVGTDDMLMQEVFHNCHSAGEGPPMQACPATCYGIVGGELVLEQV